MHTSVFNSGWSLAGILHIEGLDLGEMANEQIEWKVLPEWVERDEWIERNITIELLMDTIPAKHDKFAILQKGMG